MKSNINNDKKFIVTKAESLKQKKFIIWNLLALKWYFLNSYNSMIVFK